MICKECQIDFVSLGLEELNHHTLSQHRNRLELSLYGEVNHVRLKYTVTLWRASDLLFYCPFQGCRLRCGTRPILEDHIAELHPLVIEDGNIQNFTPEVKQRKGKCMEWHYYLPVLAGKPGIVNTSTRQPTSSHSTQTSITKAPEQLRPTYTAESSEAETTPATSTASKIRKAEPTKSEQLRASLRDEYMKRLHEDMMETLSDCSRAVDFKESSRRREEMEAWFEEGMRMLLKVDGSVDA
ncbi:hypothetical protein BJ508DRAFT_313780 [Ascobolus immersus RN42]|uniref:C2H2-type domain-containing protein n=1 Tax=Ascobolus immersus RN42 TaxID=1160509 RepID=A0A3N4HLS1_ASCIM|nr:hypothetical protein BJ508DRAFT_313780 [Ascobolus immersus RN42]